MHSKIQKWGHSLALHIPKAFARNAKLRQGSVVDFTEKGGRLTIVPVSVPKTTLESLLSGITKKNLHREADTGAPAGNETW